MKSRISTPFLLFSALLLALTARAQTFTGAVLGRVLDPQQAGIANAAVTLHSVDQGFERRTTADPEGTYHFSLVPPGRFLVRAEAHDFATSTVNVEVVVATPVRADLILQVQELQQEVRVVGENGVAVQTENADLGRTINPHQMSELPSLTRSPYDFMALMPGATLTNDLLGVGFAVNGSRTQSANYLLDGSENNDTFMSAPAQDVPLDAIEEFSVQTNHYSAEYGRRLAPTSFTAHFTITFAIRHWQPTPMTTMPTAFRVRFLTVTNLEEHSAVRYGTTRYTSSAQWNRYWFGAAPRKLSTCLLPNCYP
jgi:hypothetical protein